MSYRYIIIVLDLKLKFCCTYGLAHLLSHRLQVKLIIDLILKYDVNNSEVDERFNTIVGLDVPGESNH